MAPTQYRSQRKAAFLQAASEMMSAWKAGTMPTRPPRLKS